MKIKRQAVRMTAVMLTLLLLPVYRWSSFRVSAQSGEDNAISSEYPGTGRLELDCEEDTGRITVYDRQTGETWCSSPTASDLEQEESTGISKAVLESNLIIYTVEPGENDNIAAQNRWASSTASVQKGGLTVEKLDWGYRLTYHFDRADITVPLEVYLDGDALVARVCCDEIQETGSNRLYWISILPYFGAGSSSDDGYLLIPDGSGALIYYNNGKNGYETYHEPVYGKDLVYTGHSQPVKKQNINMPIFASVKNENAVLGIISQGAGAAYIDAHTAGQVNGYNTVYPTFYLYASDQLFIGSNASGQSRSVTKFSFQEKLIDQCEVRYLFPDEGSYSGVARCYQNYLLETKQAERKEDAVQLPLYVELFGGFRKEESVLGFVVNRYKTMTSFQQGEEIVRRLEQGDVDHFIVNYVNWMGSQADGKLQTKASAAWQLGGEQARKEFSATVLQAGGQVFYSFDPMKIQKNSFAFWSFLDSARKIGGAPILLYEYSPAYGYSYEDEAPAYLPMHQKLSNTVESFFDSAAKTALEGVYLPSLTSTVYSSLSPKNFVTREEACRETEGLLQNHGIPLMGQESNIYAIGAVDYVLDAPAYTTRQNIVDESIPFYQLVISGLAGYSTPCVNSEGNLNTMLLKSLETGGGLFFSWVYNDPSEFMETEYDVLYGTRFEEWAEDAIAAYHQVNAVLEQVGSTRLIAHKKLADDVYLSSYEGGAGIITNYSASSFAWKGYNVEPGGWCVVQKGDAGQ